jgi:AP-2 complex subunit mu-1
MISVLMFLNSRGDVVLSRSFRTGFNVRTLAETFRNELISPKLVDRCPVNFVNHICFIHLKLTDLYVVMVTNSNTNCLVCLQYGVRLLQYIQSYFENLDEKAVKNNYVTLQSVIDESMDFGYPILTDMEAMPAFITNDGVVADVLKNTKESERIADRLTGVTPWRVEGCIYQNNEVFVDVFENVNLLLAQSGEVLQCNVTGRVVMSNFLSGMPECELHWNAKVMNRSQAEPAATDNIGEELVPLSDISFHNCVRLNAKGEEERCLTFVPPDGKFTLMTYRSSVNVQPPIKAISATARELSRTRTELEFTLKSDAPPGQTITEIAVTVPCPENTAAATIKVPSGKATYDAVSHGIVWKLTQMRSGEEIPFFAEVRQIAPTEATETLWSKPPITIAFQCVSLSLTGLRINELKVNEPVLMYKPNKWIRYTVMAGDYQCRM